MIQAVVDRFEEGRAVLYLGEDEKKVVFPGEYLPQGTREGDYLSIEISIDEKTTQEARTEAERLLEKLKKQTDQ